MASSVEVQMATEKAQAAMRELVHAIARDPETNTLGRKVRWRGGGFWEVVLTFTDAPACGFGPDYEPED